MSSFYFFFFLIVFPVLAQPRIQVIPDPQSLEDFDHQFKGCPENSECDQVMGHLITQWKEVLKKCSADAAKNKPLIDAFRIKFGLPFEFYTTKASLQSFKPVLNSSPCKEHNPKNGEKIFRGLAFVRTMNNKLVKIWRDQSQIEVEPGKILFPQEVLVYYDKSPTSYYLPLDEQPLFIKNRQLYIIREDEGIYYSIKINEQGDWQLADIDMTQLSWYERKKQDTDCPSETQKKSSVFQNEFCREIWDVDSKKVIKIKMQSGCSI